MKRSSPKTATAVFFAAFSATVILTASPAIAGNPSPRPGQVDDTADLVSFVNSRFAVRAEAVRYADPESGHGFTLDRTGAQALLKFDDSDEVIALFSTAGNGGADYLKNDAGRIMLKITERGNVIAYSPGDDGGTGVVESGVAEVLDLPTAPADMAGFVASQKDELGHVLGKTPIIHVDASLTDYEGWASEAMRMATSGISLAEQRKPTGLKEVSLIFADQPGARFDDAGALTISVAPHMGFAGRPSSELVARTLALADRRS